MIGAVRAVEQASVVEEWSCPHPRLPLDDSAILTTLVPLLGVAVVIGGLVAHEASRTSREHDAPACEVSTWRTP